MSKIWFLTAIVLVFIPVLQCVQDKQGCGHTKSCFSLPADCQSYRSCDYLLKYSVNGTDVFFELMSRRFQWVAVGFNKINGMVPGNALVCESHGSKVVLNRYEMKTRTPRKLKETYANLTASISLTGVMTYCSFTRKINPGGDSFDLGQSVHFLYAAGKMDGSTILEHIRYDSSHKPVNVLSITDNSVNSNVLKRINTDSCGKSLICLRMSDGCADNTVCDILVTIKKSASLLEFSLSGKSQGWVSVGFNDRTKMSGTDAVVCYRDGTTQNVSLGTAKLKYRRPNLLNSSDVKLLEGKFEGGIVYCKFTRPLKSNGGLDLGVSRYIIYGKGSGAQQINKHKGSGSKGCSTIKVDFNSNKNYKFGDCHGSGIPKLHGALMIFAWMFLVVVSIFIARYSRKLWGGRKISDVDMWFLLHRLTMLFAIIMVLTSIIIVFVYVGGWSEMAGDHAVFGIIVVVLAIIQPSIAFFRPSPGTTRRPIFNWVHRFIALLVVVLSVVTIFKGAELVKEDGGEVVSKIMIVLILVAIITALALEFLAYRIRTEQNHYVAELSTGQSRIEQRKNMWEQKAQRALLVLLFVVVFILVVTMIAYVAGAGGDHDDDDDDDDHGHDSDDDD